MYKKIKSEIDKAIGKSQKEVVEHVERALYMGIPYAKRDFINAQKMVKYLVDQLGRVSNTAIMVMTDYAIGWVKRNAVLVSSDQSPMEFYMDFPKDEINQRKAEMLLMNAVNKIPKMYLFSEPLTKIADGLNNDDRKLLATYCHYQISILAIQTNWDKDTIKVAMSLLSVEYAICEKDGVMDLFFNSTMSVISRLNSSMHKQQARDLAETTLVIGYREHLEEYPYVVASSSYIDSSSPLGALLYLEIAFTYLERYKVIPKRIIFDIIWTILKVLREVNRYDEKEMNCLLAISDSIGCNAFEKMSVYYTVLTAKVFTHDETSISETIRFLKENETDILSFKKRVALPLYTLFKSIHEVFGDHDLSGLAPYEEIVEKELVIEGNELYIDFFDDSKSLANHLLTIMTRLNSDRYSANYSHDSTIAKKMARKVVESSVKDNNPEEFLLAMMVRADYTFVKQDRYKAPLTVMEIEDDNIEGHQPYISVTDLKKFLRPEHEDIIMWIGLGDDHVCRLSLMNEMFGMDYLESLKLVDTQTVQQDVVSKLQFRSDYITRAGDRFEKTEKELAEESVCLFETLKSCCLSIPNVAGRAMFVKDMELESYPHQLFVDERLSEFVGQRMPTANIISTELLIKTNRSELLLPHNFSRSFWTPIQSGEITFSGIKSHLANTLSEYQFLICETNIPVKPLSSDMNIVCAHGGKNISESEWFYANSQPIIDTDKIVGSGKLLILFVCHSGSAIYKEYDGAVHTIVKRYIRMGYKSVIAPMWSLSAEILPLWLATFMDHFMHGEYIIDAVFHSNMAIKEKFVSPSAWACLHLFGNPYLQVGNKD